VTVALSGDGADELLAGYRKHVALQAAMGGGFYPAAARLLAPLTSFFSQGRHGTFANKMRQIKRFNDGLSLPKADRYWLWASIYSQKQATSLLSAPLRDQLNKEQLAYRQQVFTQNMNGATDINEFLYADMQLVLPNDMLTKVDLMSMAHGLEVRVPFLDHEVVEYAFSLPAESKLKGSFRKRVLQDAFKDILPADLYNRPKQGFEIPLKDWLKKELKSTIENELLEPGWIKEQNIFNEEKVGQLKKQLFSNNVQDAPAQIWSLLVFQNWWGKYFG